MNDIWEAVEGKPLTERELAEIEARGDARVKLANELATMYGYPITIHHVCDVDRFRQKRWNTNSIRSTVENNHGDLFDEREPDSAPSQGDGSDT